MQASFARHRSDDAQQYVLQILFVPPSLPLTSLTIALRRQCVAKYHLFTAQTHSTAITLLFPRSGTFGERSQCYKDASVRKLHSSLVQDQAPKYVCVPL